MRRVRRNLGFTLIELMVVVTLVALATAGVTLALRDDGVTRLEREALRLSALIEAARAQSRTSGVPVVWRSLPQGFEFVGIPAPSSTVPSPDRQGGPRTWLSADTVAQVTQPAGALNLVLGPEPLIAAQRLVLRQGDRRLTLATDGLSPFAVVLEAP